LSKTLETAKTLTIAADHICYARLQRFCWTL